MHLDRAADSAERCPRECFGYLAREPSSSRMLGYSRAYNLPAIVGQNDHDYRELKRSGRHNEHIDRSDALGVIAQEAAPGWGRRTSPSDHILSDRSLADLDSQLEQFAMDPRCTPRADWSRSSAESDCVSEQAKALIAEPYDEYRDRLSQDKS